MTKRLLALACLAALAVAFAPSAQAGSKVDRATGGGQVLIGTRGGAGDTIAFTARGTSAAARGEVQYVDRTADGQTVWHGTVTCLRVSGNTAKLAGTWDRPGGTFQLLVVDNGEGAAAENDMVTVQNNQPNDCAEDDDDDEADVALARGNAQVYDAP